MKERPILMSGEMVKAILDGRKTQTRRAVKPQPVEDSQYEGWLVWQGGPSLLKASYGADYVHSDEPSVKRAMEKCCVHGKPGDRIWVKETWGDLDADHPTCKEGRKPKPGDRLVYRANPADDAQWGSGLPSQGSFCWRPSIFMPRWASRLTLEITNVRVERLQDIDEDDAKAEGIEGRWHPDDPHLWTWRDYGTPGRFAYGSMFGPVESYQTLWNSINGKGAWDKNPYVWVIEFERLNNTCAPTAAALLSVANE